MSKRTWISPEDGEESGEVKVHYGAGRNDFTFEVKEPGEARQVAFMTREKALDLAAWICATGAGIITLSRFFIPLLWRSATQHKKAWRMAS